MPYNLWWSIKYTKTTENTDFLTIMLCPSWLQHNKQCVKICGCCATQSDKDRGNKMWEYAKACMCVCARVGPLTILFNFFQVKQDCWLVYSTKCLPANFIFFHPLLNYFSSHSKPTLAPGANTSRTKHCLSIEEFSVGLISIFAQGQTVINDWYFALACRHELRVMTFSVSEISLYAPQRIEGHICGNTHSVSQFNEN